MYLLTGNLSVAAAASVARPERITEVAKLEAAILKGHPNGARCKSHVLMCPPSSCGFILGFITEYFIPTFQQLETSCFFGGDGLRCCGGEKCHTVGQMVGRWWSKSWEHRWVTLDIHFVPRSGKEVTWTSSSRSKQRGWRPRPPRRLGWTIKTSFDLKRKPD